MSKNKSLIGRWFHAFEPCESCERPQVTWQGQIIGRPAPRLYLVELYEWISGFNSKEQLVALEAMTGWALYATSEQMNATYENGLAFQHDDCRKTSQLAAAE